MTNFLYHTRGSALLISLVVLTILTIATTVFLEKIWGFSRASEWIENSNIAYYNALWWIEQSLMQSQVSKNSPWAVNNTSSGSMSETGIVVTASTWGFTIPIAGKGNSIYDSTHNWNIISLGQPVQIVVPHGLDWNGIFISLRVPQIGTAGTGVDVSMSTTGVVLWGLASSGASLFASGETNVFRGWDINNGLIPFGAKMGISNSGSNVSLDSFYETTGYLGPNGLVCSGYRCTLKLSLLRPIEINTPKRTINFLEYQITGFGQSVPSQFMTIRAEGYQHGFLRSREIQIPQITTNTALDFAILQ